MRSLIFCHFSRTSELQVVGCLWVMQSCRLSTSIEFYHRPVLFIHVANGTEASIDAWRQVPDVLLARVSLQQLAACQTTHISSALSPLLLTGPTHYGGGRTEVCTTDDGLIWSRLRSATIKFKTCRSADCIRCSSGLRILVTAC